MLILDGEVVQGLVLQHGQINWIVGNWLSGIAALRWTLEVDGRHIGISQRLLVGHIAGSHCMASGIRTIDTSTSVCAQMLRINRGLKK